MFGVIVNHPEAFSDIEVKLSGYMHGVYCTCTVRVYIMH